MKTIIKPILVSSLLVAAFGVANAQDKLWSLTVSAGVQHSDNKDQADPNNPASGTVKDEWRLNLGPTLRLRKEIVDRLYLNASYSPTFMMYSHADAGDTKRSWKHTFRGIFDYQFSPRTKFSLTDSYWWTDNDLEDESGLTPEHETSRISDQYAQNALSLSLTHFVSPKAWGKVTLRNRTKRYNEDVLARYSDEDELGARLDAIYNESRFLSWGAFIDYTDWERASDYPGFNNRLYVGTEYFIVGLQATVDLGGDKNNLIYASLGYNHVGYKESALDDRDYFGDMRLELRLFQLHETQLLAGLRRGLDYADTYPFSTQEDLATYVSLIRYFGEDRRLRLNASAEYRFRQYESDEDIDPAIGTIEGYEGLGVPHRYDRDSIYFRFAFAYRYNEKLTFNGFYTYEKIDADIGVDFDENVFGLSATYRYW